MRRGAPSPRPPCRRSLAAVAALAALLALATGLPDPLAADPWPRFLLGAFAAAAVLAWALRPVALRVAAANLAAVLLALAGFERWIALTSGEAEKRAIEDPVTESYLIRPDALLGYAPARGTTARMFRARDGRLLYDVRISIGPDGFRVAPPPVVDPPEGTLLVAGCSFAYGEGLNDADTLPGRLAGEAGRRLLVRNLAFSGWGPHQLLALVESGRALAGAPAGRPVTVLYETLADHVPRALGRRPWSRATPRYVPDATGRVVRDGSFGGLDPTLERWVTYRRVFGSERRVTDGEVARVVAILARARELVLGANPGTRFEVLLWDERDDLTAAYRSALVAAGFRVHDVSRILPGYPADRRWQLPGDGHPTAEANARLARALAPVVLETRPGVSPPAGAPAPPPLPPSAPSPTPTGS